MDATAAHEAGEKEGGEESEERRPETAKRGVVALTRRNTPKRIMTKTAPATTMPHTHRERKRAREGESETHTHARDKREQFARRW